MSLLAERLLAIHGSLSAANLPHAFGGAIALAYCTREPRGTRDLDVNVFVPPGRAREVLDALPSGVEVRDADRRRAEREGQVRVFWDETPVDLFLDTHPIHTDAAAEVRDVAFEGDRIPVLGCGSLLVFKAMYNRTRDWADIEAMLEAGVDGRGPLERLRKLLGATDPVVHRLSAYVDPSFEIT